MVEKVWEVAEKKNEDLLLQLLINRGLTTSEAQTIFLQPLDPTDNFELSLQLSGLDGDQLTKACTLIKEVISTGQPIIVHGDYDVDGLAATAILWETIYFGLGYKNVHPFIPNRFTDGYGLSRDSLEKISQDHNPLENHPLLITVDCGITANEEINRANALGFRVIIVDHHTQSGQLPGAAAVVWTGTLCSGGISWFIARSLIDRPKTEQLDLVALATVADLQTLVGLNRSFVRHGLAVINRNPRPGIKALMKISGMEKRPIGTYELGWIFSPRLNAAGRLESALASLRLLVTRNVVEAERIAASLDAVNSERRRILQSSLSHARALVTGMDLKKIILVADESYHEGVIGLVAGKLTQEFSRPSLVIAKGETLSKGSARSVGGFNMIEALRKAGELFEGVGGHPMAAGFTIRNENIPNLENLLSEISEDLIDGQMLKPKVMIDAELPANAVDGGLLEIIRQLEPVGVGNPAPVFVARGLAVTGIQQVGSAKSHLKIDLLGEGQSLKAIWFGAGRQLENYPTGRNIDVVFTALEDSWNGNKRVSLNVKDVKVSA